MADEVPSVYTNPSTWRQETAINKIKYRLIERSGTFGYDKVDCTETVLIQASDLQAFVREVLPLPTFTNNGLPIWQATAMKGSLPLIAKNVTWSAHVDGLPIDPFGADPGAPEGTYKDILKVTISYDDDPGSPGSGSGNGVDPNDPETFLEISCNASGEFLRNQSIKAFWYDDLSGDVTPNLDAESPNSILVPELEWNFTWPMLNYDFYHSVMVPRLRTAMGKVNSDSFTLLHDAPAETILLVGWDQTEEHQMLFSDEVQNPQYLKNPVKLTVKMLEKNVGSLKKDDGSVSEKHVTVGGSITDGKQYIGHNHFWDPTTGTWKRIIINQPGFGAKSIYEEYDFNGLFAVPPIWAPGEAVKFGDERLYFGVIYYCIQSHTTQLGYEPPNAPTLWSTIKPNSD